MRRIDLHTHSTASDGSLAPAAVVHAAQEAGLAAVALADHDTTAGLADAVAAGARAGVEVVPAVELSVDARGHDAHLLGYLFDPTHPAVEALLARGRDSRDRRNPRIVERLRALGVPITMEEVVAFARSADAPLPSIGRPHIAGVLVEKGVASSVKDAFDRFLAEGRPAFVPRARTPGWQAIAAVHAAGGVAVLAHPVTIPAPEREAVVVELAEAGLDGLEVVHSKHGPAEREAFGSLAKRLDLAPSGGSDFHGGAKPDVAIGTGKDGNVEVPYAWLDGLRARRP